MPDDVIKVVTLKDKLRCPHCDSNKWKWIKTIPASPKSIGKFLVMLYECEKCGKEFIAQEKATATLVKSAEKCTNCNSTHIEKISRPNADLELYFCKQCRCYMGIEKII